MAMADKAMIVAIATFDFLIWTYDLLLLYGALIK
jgi:hypothetical protein